MRVGVEVIDRGGVLLTAAEHIVRWCATERVRERACLHHSSEVHLDAECARDFII